MGSCQSTEAAVAGTSSSVTYENPGASHASVEQRRAEESAAAKPKQIEAGETLEIVQVDMTTATTKPGVTLVPLNGGSDTETSSRDYTPGYSSGASTPADCRSLDGSVNNGSTSGKNPKSLVHSTSVLGLDSMIESRKEEGDLKSNVVHIEVPFGKPIEEVYDGVHDGPVLGSGISGLVRLVTHKATGIKYAVKCLDLGLVETEEGLQQLREEIFIMCQLDHPNIVRLEEVYESHSEIYLVQELCTGGELFDRLDEQPDYHYTEAECARLVKNMLCAVRYLHSQGIIHRDLKLENFLFSTTNPDSELKMIDFGLSKHFKYGEVQHEAVGTPYTVAPEVIRGSYDERCDIWAIGVITFLLLSGDPPFGGCGGPEPLMTVRSNILKGSYEFEPADIWSIVSPAAKDFINSLLVIDPKKRPTAKAAQKLTWLREWASRQKRKGGDKLNPNVVSALVNFKEYSDMRKLLCEVLSFTLLPDQIKDLRKEFEKMDTDGSGEISLAGLKQVLLTNAGSGTLGALTETEVEDIFNAMRVRKTETRIHWHEFIAAGLSQCQVDERNLRLAFDRLDSDHKGYITFEDVMDLMGNDAYQSEEAMRSMWRDSMNVCNGNHARITYDDFLLLMKGQTIEQSERSNLVGPPKILGKLDAVPEINESCNVSSASLKPEDVVMISLPAGGEVVPSATEPADGELTQVPAPLSPSTPPLTPLFSKNAMQLDSNATIEVPLSMDEDDDNEPCICKSPMSSSSGGIGALTPPQSPIRSAVDFISPAFHKATTPIFRKGGIPEIPSRPNSLGQYGRRRSRSVDDQDPLRNGRSSSDLDHPSLNADARRAVAMPEHEHDPKIENLIMDESKTPLVVNRQLYRAHRTMRLAVLEATKRFEEQQARRAQEILSKEDDSPPQQQPVGAGLVLRHGLKKQVSSKAVQNWLKKSQEEHAAMVEKANKRTGRGRSRRQKTVSDMAGMLANLDTSIVALDVGKASPTEVSSGRERPVPDRSLIHGRSESQIKQEKQSNDDFPPIRNATVPGEFRKTRDPFTQHKQFAT